MAIIFGLKYPYPMEMQALFSIDEESVVNRKDNDGLQRFYEFDLVYRGLSK